MLKENVIYRGVIVGMYWGQQIETGNFLHWLHG